MYISRMKLKFERSCRYAAMANGLLKANRIFVVDVRKKSDDRPVTMRTPFQQCGITMPLMKEFPPMDPFNVFLNDLFSLLDQKEVCL